MSLAKALLEANEADREQLRELDETAALLLGPGATADDDPGLRASIEHMVSTRGSGWPRAATEKAIASGDAREHGRIDEETRRAVRRFANRGPDAGEDQWRYLVRLAERQRP